MIDALIFDFDGVVVDSEPIHLACFRAVLAKRGIELTEEDYYSKYLGYDDHDCFLHVLKANGRAEAEADIAAMTAEKTQLVQEAYRTSVQSLPGAVELMAAARAAGVPVAVCSGALQHEIEQAGRTVGALQYVEVLVAAKDVQHGKPDPEGYLLALRLLNERAVADPSPSGRGAVVRGEGGGAPASLPPIRPERTWVIEDSPAGVQAAQGAGCKVIAVTNSYARPALAAADRIVDSLTEVDLAGLT